MSEPILKVDKLSKTYQFNRGNTSLGESLNEQWTRLMGKKKGKKKERSFFAIKDISFELNAGDVLGVIGKNGSGKSTLLKILSNITPPSGGKFWYKGKMGSILEIGSGFHTDLSGKENIYLNGSMLGLSRKEIDAKLNQIIAFSGVEEFIDLPVKHYSNGMFLRLAFSIAFHSQVDILLLDEVIAVGDAEFSMKSTNKIQELINKGVTIIVVSHNMNEIFHLCNKCLLLNHGELVGFGTPAQLINEHLTDSFAELFGDIKQKDDEYEEGEGEDKLKPEILNFEPQQWAFEQAPGGEEVKLKSLTVRGETKKLGERMTRADNLIFEMEYWKLSSGWDLHIVLNFFDRLFNPIFDSCSAFYPEKVKYFESFSNETGIFRYSCHVPNNLLNPGIYSVNLVMTANRERMLLNLQNSINFRIFPGPGEKDAFETPFSLSPALKWELDHLGN